MKEKPKKSVRMWVARDKDGSLYLYKNKPTEKTNGSDPQWLTTSFHVIGLDPDLFPSVKWEDNELTKVIIRLAQYGYKKKHFRKYTCHYQ